ncbi:MAG: hypothetical protein K2X82_08365 [Gemmataceae bacterium]|nr:hypothetical protein [Gemmataceae bacterium]
MSAFAVSNLTIHRVVTLIDPAADCAALDKLGRELLTMNRKALLVRYGQYIADENLPQSRIDAYEFRPLGSGVPDIDRYKASRCLLYQCNEDPEVESDPLYVRLEAASFLLARNIVAYLPEYEKSDAWQ